MTSYRLRQDFFSFTTAMTIGDADGQDRFRVEGTWLSTGVTLTDLATGDALVLQPEIFSLKTVWHVLRGGIEVATFESEGWLAQTFNLDVPGPNDFTIAQQSLMSFDVAFTRPEDGQVGPGVCPRVADDPDRHRSGARAGRHPHRGVHGPSCCCCAARAEIGGQLRPVSDPQPPLVDANAVRAFIAIQCGMTHAPPSEPHRGRGGPHRAPVHDPQGAGQPLADLRGSPAKPA